MKKILVFIVLMIFFVQLHAQESKSSVQSAHSTISGIIKTDLPAFYLGSINIAYEMPFDKSSFTISGALTPNVETFEIGLLYNYYLLNKAPYGLYISPGVSLGYSGKVSESGILAGALVRSGYNLIIKDKMSLDFSIGFGTVNIPAYGSEKAWLIGFSVGSIGLRK